MNARITWRTTTKLGMTAVLACAVSSAGLAGNAWEDRLGRFALDLPAGYELKTESGDSFYTFGDSNPVGNICLVYRASASSLEEMFDSLVSGVTGHGFDAPPAGAVANRALDGATTRWAEYRTAAEFDGREVEFTVYVGAVFAPGSGSAGFVTYSVVNGGNDDHRRLARQAFDSIRLDRRSPTGNREAGSIEVVSRRIEP
jgi:hypothetical protein